mmetsp:Transcript_27333/g.38473  ORF Transcript_27333/g.38473 Transcript_27333/m.38473 type:complete len:225 (+) Transcript_27333:235-909(+)
MSSTAATAAFRNLAISLPIAIWSVDNLVSLARVRGTSMEPTLKDGDIVLVKKSDFFPGFWGTSNHKPNNNAVYPSDDDDGGSPNTTRRSNSDETDRARLARVEASIGNTPSTLWSKPPEILSGHVVVYKSPNNAYPHEYHIKRVVAIGGQMIRPTQRLRSIEHIPKYSIWAEGDNSNIQSEDSCSYGPVSKKLLEGRADRVVWPPWRWGALEKKYPSSGKAWWP